MNVRDWNCQQLGIVNASYEELKEQHGYSHRVTVRMIERAHGLKRNQLKNYRDNHINRKPLDTCSELTA